MSTPKITVIFLLILFFTVQAQRTLQAGQLNECGRAYSADAWSQLTQCEVRVTTVFKRALNPYVMVSDGAHGLIESSARKNRCMFWNLCHVLYLGAMSRQATPINTTSTGSSGVQASQCTNLILSTLVDRLSSPGIVQSVDRNNTARAMRDFSLLNTPILNQQCQAITRSPVVQRAATTSPVTTARLQ